MTSTLTYSNTIANPFKRGDKVLIPAGTPLRSMHPERRGEVYYSKRAQTITVHHRSDGYVDTTGYSGEGRGFINLPTVTWPGTGGYWVDAMVTPELCAVNGVDVPVIPVTHPYEADRLDVIPAYGAGYDNRDV